MCCIGCVNAAQIPPGDYVYLRKASLACRLGLSWGRFPFIISRCPEASFNLVDFLSSIITRHLACFLLRSCIQLHFVSHWRISAAVVERDLCRSNRPPSGPRPEGRQLRPSSRQPPPSPETSTRADHTGNRAIRCLETHPRGQLHLTSRRTLVYSFDDAAHPSLVEPNMTMSRSQFRPDFNSYHTVVCA